MCGTHFPATSELSQFVLASPTAKRRTVEPLASVLKEGFRKRGERDFLKRDFRKRRYISKQEKDNNGLAYITLGREKLTTSHIPL